MAGFTVEVEDKDYKVEIVVHYENGLDPQIPWNALAQCCGDAEVELNYRIMAYLDSSVASEANRIVASTPTVRAWQSPPKRGPGRPPRDHAYFGHLTTGQVAAIRRKVAKKGREQIPALAEFYGVEELYVERALGKQPKKNEVVE